ncbi:chaperonin 10-like protein [Protomyces lactucae-debilis]|uniref:Chaperonin 10-like protein n=1 Tax=Protomyces lactucae-debilis TaxID=2754530 RepID=A0A1Y2EV07_PROLT|nr:chaperonin 10-like protein [Protomyces lactucae-debilis]ORY75412.1 chaperonin 10-like protein [Protomyces lactucae-debilis]
MSMRALITSNDHKAVLKDVTRPAPKAGTSEVLVKVKSLAQNPTDWKGLNMSPEGRIIGCDFSGTVEEIAEGATGAAAKLEKGQRVAGFVHGLRDEPLRGAFAEYVLTEAEQLYHVPKNTSDEEAAATSLAFATAVQAINQRLGVPDYTQPAKTPQPILIYGGSSSVGKYAIQLAKAGGYTVLATASKKNHGLLKELGADEVFDYADASWPEKAAEAAKGQLKLALDCISEGETTLNVAKALSSEGGKITTLLPPQKKDEIAKLNSKITADMTLIYTVFGRSFSYGPFEFHASEEDKAFWVKTLEALPEMLEKGVIKPNKVTLLDGGLDGILAGFKRQQEGGVSAEKLCYRLA